MNDFTFCGIKLCFRMLSLNALTRFVWLNDEDMSNRSNRIQGLKGWNTNFPYIKQTRLQIHWNKTISAGTSFIRSKWDHTHHKTVFHGIRHFQIEKQNVIQRIWPFGAQDCSDIILESIIPKEAEYRNLWLSIKQKHRYWFLNNKTIQPKYYLSLLTTKTMKSR